MTDDEIIGRAVVILDARIRTTVYLQGADDTKTYLRLKLGGIEREVFAVLLLDARHGVIEYEEVFFGTLAYATVHPRELVKTVLKHNAGAMILVHNHPSGVVEPSETDVSLTRRVREALALVDVRVLDHMVVTRGEVVSMSERGLI